MITSQHGTRRRLLAALLAGSMTLAFAGPSLAQRGEHNDAKEPQSEAKRLPADVTTDQSIELPDRTLRFKAVAGTIPINNGDGKLQAEIAFIAYLKPDAEPGTRPLTFAVNGGPGASSAYLQLGAIGPWRLPLDNISIKLAKTTSGIRNPMGWAR